MRKVWDIPGGVHPPQNKSQSVANPIVKAPLPEQLIFPLSQHIGAPAKPIVAVGDRVLKGQMIAEARGFVSVPVHASSSGTVTDIGPHAIAHSSGMPAPCIVIACDGKDEWMQKHEIVDYQQVEKSELLDIIHDAGIAGMGGAGFPSAVKLSTQPHHTIETLIINGTECEPYITADDVLMRERADEIIKGAEILRHIIGPSETLIGVEDNKPGGIAALQKAAEGSGIKIVCFPTKYPSGGEKQLIQILTGKEVPSGKLPADVSVVCQNLGTTVAVYRAVRFGEPLISRITTVTGEAVDQPQNYEALLGTPLSCLLELSGYHPERNQRLLMGGPMMGFALDSSEVPLVKTTNCILAPTEEELPTPPPQQACIRCGMCAEACPISLLPQQLYWFAQGKEHEKLESHNIFDCIECGACSYACPSNIPLVQYYRASKADIRQSYVDQTNSDRSRIRFEARQARLDAEETAKQERRKARKAAAEKRAAEGSAPGEDKQDAIQAAIERAKAARATGDSASPIEKSQQKLQSLQKRLETSEQKLANSGDDEQGEKIKTALIASISLLKEKIVLAETELADIAENPESKPNSPAASDPAKAAIEPAMAKRAAAAAPLSPQQQLKKNQAAVEKRLDAAREKLAQAREEQSDTVSILKTSTEKLEVKLDKIKVELREFTQGSGE